MGRSRFPAYPPNIDDQLQLFLESLRKEVEGLGVSGGASIQVQEAGAVVSSAANILNFAGADFDLTHSPVGTVNIVINANRARLDTDQTWTGLQTFDRDPGAPFAVTAGSAVVTNLNADLLDGQHGSFYQNAGNLNAGVLLDARVQQSNVTQHQAALSIAETQIPDGAIFARVASAETVTGLWTFSRGAAVPFAVAAGSLKVTNLDSDLLDGFDETAFGRLAAARTWTATQTFDSSTARLDFTSVTGEKIRLWSTTFGIAINSSEWLVFKPSASAFRIRDNATTGTIRLELTTANVLSVAGGAVFGTDPTGSEILRLGGSARVNGDLILDGVVRAINFEDDDVVIQRAGVTKLTLATALATFVDNIALTTAVSQIIPGATSFAVRNNANSANNLLLADGGVVTIRNNLVITGASRVINFSGGDIAIQRAGSTRLSGTATLLTSAGDFAIGTLGTFDSASVPDLDDVLRYNGTKWIPVALQFRFTDGDVVAQAFTDGTSAALVDDGRTVDDTPAPVAPSVAPTLQAGYKSILVDLTGLGALPADKYWVVQWSDDAGISWSDAAGDEIVTSGDKVMHTKLPIDGTQFRYRVRQRGATTSATSPSTADLAPLTEPDITPATIILASQIATVDLSAISANIGVITAGVIRNSADSHGILVSGVMSDHTSWTRFLNLVDETDNFIEHERFKVHHNGSITVTNGTNTLFSINTAGTQAFWQDQGATQGLSVQGAIPGTWVRYIGLDDANTFFIKHPQFEVQHDGRVRVLSGANTLFEINAASTSAYWQNTAATAGINVMGTLPGTWTRYLNLNGSGIFLKHDKLELNYTGSPLAIFKGGLDIEALDVSQPGEPWWIVLRQPTLAHGMTAVVNTDVAATVGPISSAFVDGGLRLTGYSDTLTGLVLHGIGTDTAGSDATIILKASHKSGTGIGALASGAFAVQFMSHTTSLMKLRDDGQWRMEPIAGGGFLIRQASTPTIVPLEVLQGTLTGSQALQALVVSTTWNTTGVPVLSDFVATDTASNAESLLARWRIGGSNKVTIRKDGKLVTVGEINSSNITVEAANQPFVHIKGTNASATDIQLVLERVGATAQRWHYGLSVGETSQDLVWRDQTGAANVARMNTDGALSTGMGASKVLNRVAHAPFTAANLTTTSTAETEIALYTVPANTLARNGAGLRIRACFHSTSTSRFFIALSSTTVADRTTAVNGAIVWMDVDVVRTNSTTLLVSAVIHDDNNTSTFITRTTVTVTLSSGFAVRFRVDQVAAGTATLQTASIIMLDPDTTSVA